MELERIVEDPVIKLDNGHVSFEIHKGFNGEIPYEISQHIPNKARLITEMDSLVVEAEMDGIKSYMFLRPDEFAAEHYMELGRLTNIRAIQVIPVESSENRHFYKMIMGTDNSCCNGAVFYMDLEVLKVDDRVDVRKELLNGVRVPFNIGGILGTDKATAFAGDREGGTIVYGSGCAGSGIRLIDFQEGAMSEIMSSNEVNMEHRYCQFFNKPFVRGGTLFVPGHDKRGLYDRAPVLNKWPAIDIEDKFRKTQNDFAVKEVLPQIKESVAKSRFIYREK